MLCGRPQWGAYWRRKFYTIIFVKQRIIFSVTVTISHQIIEMHISQELLSLQSRNRADFQYGFENISNAWSSIILIFWCTHDTKCLAKIFLMQPLNRVCFFNTIIAFNYKNIFSCNLQQINIWNRKSKTFCKLPFLLIGYFVDKIKNRKKGKNKNNM